MSRITKDIAVSVSKALTEKLEEQIVVQAKVCSDIVRSYKNIRTPKEVNKMFEIHPNYFRQVSYVSVSGNGFNHESFSMNPMIVSTSSGGYSEAIQLTEGEAEGLMPEWRKLQEIRKQKDELQLSIQTTLYGLKTYNKVKLEFPEAYEFLPEKAETGLSVPLANIREQLKAIQ